jgi:hypothetical protein
LEPPLLDRALSAVSPTGNSYGSLGVQFRKKFKKLKMFLMLLSVAHQKIYHMEPSFSAGPYLQ